jgi:hypothetical protein
MDHTLTKGMHETRNRKEEIQEKYWQAKQLKIVKGCNRGK